ncbi:MAG: 4Fe-4S binding protein [Candidatus Omnitrophica bacterium]|nr:4Fe-4S binding protein [Candidatus Omnitrophota bacterium]MDD5080053.1 4Fe-4S binding protein [Candidatus Omnitrophota bacterium]
MRKIIIDAEKCKGCLLCIGACPKGFLVPSGKLNRRGDVFVECKNEQECLACGLCALICPDCCIEVSKE